MPPSLYRDTETEGDVQTLNATGGLRGRYWGGGGVGGRVPKEEECEIGLGGGEVERREQVLLR